MIITINIDDNGHDYRIHDRHDASIDDNDIEDENDDNILTWIKDPALSGPRYSIEFTFTFPLINVPPTTNPTPRTSYTESMGKCMLGIRS